MSAPILIATAGHVDHGKSTLVRALTGIDPDRWEAEKERGITIDLGYAHTARDDRTYSFVDVPGHERFIHNMLAGIGSIDGVLFVIAADESIMPQTREHALALRWLGIEQVHVVLTKVDLVDADLLELLELEVDEFLAEQGWTEAQKVLFSAKQPATTEDVFALLSRFRKKDPGSGRAFRMSIDRVFTSQGTGTVLTGTVDRGSLSADEGVVIQPSGLEGRIRQLQLHGQPTGSVGAHTRVAVNLGNIHYTALHRGHCVFTRTRPPVGRKLLVRFTAFDPDWAPSAKHEFHVHHLAANLNARMLWREGEAAALELREPYAFWALDRGLIRDGTPLEIRAGFEVLDPDLTRAKRRQVRHLLDALPASGDLRAWQAWYLDHQPGLFDLAALESRCGEPLLNELHDRLVFLDQRHAMRREVWDGYRAELLDVLGACHDRLPIFTTLPRNEVNAAFREAGWPEPVLEAALAEARDAGEIALWRDRVQLTGRQARWSPEDRRLLTRFLGELDSGGLAIIDLRNLGADRTRTAPIERLLVWERFLVNLTPDLLIHHAFLARIAQTLATRFADQPFSIPELKETFGFTRKYAIPLLEYLDKSGLTRREGDSRVWIAREPPDFASSWQPPPE